MTCFIPCKNRRKHQIETRQYSSVSLWLWDKCHIRRSLNQMGKVYPGSSLLGSLSKLCQTPTLCCSWAIGFRLFWKGKVSSKIECNQTDNNHNSHVESLTIYLWNSVTGWVYCMQNAPKRTNWVWHIFRDCARTIAQFWERESAKRDLPFYLKNFPPSLPVSPVIRVLNLVWLKICNLRKHNFYILDTMLGFNMKYLA